MNTDIVAIITARGGSKGLPRKNVLDLNGKPLIAYTIDAAIASNIFSKIIVTTDDEEIKNVSLKYGADVIDRPKILATDTASSLDVIEHALNELTDQEEKFTHFILLQPTSPLRNSIHIQEAWKKYQDEKVNSLVSVCEVEHSPFKMLMEKENGEIVPLTKLEHLTMSRQKLPKTYLPNGAIYISKVDDFLKNKNLFEDKLHIYFMNNEVSIDIDDLNDFIFVEKLLNSNSKSTFIHPVVRLDRSINR